MAARRARRAALVWLVVSAGAARGAEGPAQGVVPWRSGEVILAPVTKASLDALAAMPQVNRHVVVQFAEVPSGPARQARADAGVHVLNYLGGGAYLAAVDWETINDDRGAAWSGVTGLEPLRREWKLHPRLLAGDVPPWALVGDQAGARRIAVYVVLHTDAELQPVIASIERHGGVVRGTLATINGLVTELPEAALNAVADLDGVQWIEAPLPPLGITNDQIRALTGADIAQAPPFDLDGAGIRVLVYDGGTARATHVDFEGRLSAMDGSGTISHATHVAGIIGGAGVANPSYRGVAPATTLLSYGLQGVGVSSPLYMDPGDIEVDFADAIHGGGAVVANASLGSNVEANGFDCSWQGDYGVTDILIDNIVRGSLGEPFRLVWSAGNERQSSRCDVEGFGDYYSIAPPAGAKNHLTVGAVNSNDDSMTALSSWGPTDDGRLKPDVCAPGCQSDGDFGITSCSANSDSSYITYCGTSMAAPATTGLVALLLQDFQNQFPGQPLPRNAMLRAIFAHTAVDRGNAGPDYQFGYGSVRAPAAIDVVRGGRFDEDEVDQGETLTRSVVVEPGDPELRVTLAWDDPPATPNAAVALVNDLDLVVTDPQGTRYYPWTLNPLDPSAPAVRTAPDRLNNIEQVLVDNPMPGAWTISVAGFSVPAGPQPFALVGDGAVNLATVISFPDGRPDLVAAGESYPLTVRIAAFGQKLVPGTAFLNYRHDGGDFAALPLVPQGGELYLVTLPPRMCGEDPEYYVSVESTVQGLTTLPANAPAATLGHGTGAWTPLFEDDFEQARGWTVQANAYSGNWERANPQQVVNAGVVTQPEDDHTEGAGQLCYVTGPLAGAHTSAYDVDGGPSRLISPVFNLAGDDGVVSYWRWYHLSVSADDPLVVELTNDGTNWVKVEEVYRSAEEWVGRSWRISDYVTPTATVQVRFTVNDTDPGSLMEALIDDFSILHVTCSFVAGDFDGNGAVDLADFAIFEDCLHGPGVEASESCACCDLAADGHVDLRDAASFLQLFGAAP